MYDENETSLLPSLRPPFCLQVLSSPTLPPSPGLCQSILLCLSYVKLRLPLASLCSSVPVSPSVHPSPSPLSEAPSISFVPTKTKVYSLWSGQAFVLGCVFVLRCVSMKRVVIVLGGY
ncbi:hypothetical protein RJT34_14333 [Clitoria ternatea]|uniref:Uncharacterized protein n=1 Tax=Clitoria ternatea TaxID=43366 RepID=A0AAN9JT44_CLITE